MSVTCLMISGADGVAVVADCGGAATATVVAVVVAGDSGADGVAVVAGCGCCQRQCCCKCV